MQTAILPTALQVVAGHDLGGRCAIVTGGSSGIGIETVRALATAGARVIVGARNSGKAEAIAETLRTETGNPAIIIASLDLASLRSVGEFVTRFLLDNGPLHILINNAGLITRDLRRTADGFEAHFGVQHLGHFALAKGLLPALRAAGNARIVSLTSVAHRMSDVDLDDPNFLHRPYDLWSAYAASKTASSLFTVGFMQNHAGENVTANAVHPGGILSNIWADLDLLELGLIDKTGKPHYRHRGCRRYPDAATDSPKRPDSDRGLGWHARRFQRLCLLGEELCRHHR